MKERKKEKIRMVPLWSVVLLQLTVIVSFIYSNTQQGDHRFLLLLF